MKSEINLTRFVNAQEQDYAQALAESHWIWYIFPQLSGLGFSETAKLYSIKNRQEATN